MTWSLQARAHLNFEMGVNPEALSMTEMHGVMGQNSINRPSSNTMLPDELSVRLFTCIHMLTSHPRACLSAAPAALQLPRGPQPAGAAAVPLTHLKCVVADSVPR